VPAITKAALTRWPVRAGYGGHPWWVCRLPCRPDGARDDSVSKRCACAPRRVLRELADALVT